MCTNANVCVCILYDIVHVFIKLMHNDCSSVVLFMVYNIIVIMHFRSLCPLHDICALILPPSWEVSSSPAVGTLCVVRYANRHQRPISH